MSSASTDRRCAARRVLGSRHGTAGHAFLFTLLLVALLSISVLVAVEMDSTLARRERERALLQVGHEFRLALERYQRGRAGVPGGQYPLKLDDLLLDGRYPGPVRHWRRLYPDPITGSTEWGLVRQGGRIVGLHSLSTLKPIKQDGFEPNDAAFRGAARYADWVFTYPAVRAPAAAASAASAGQGSAGPRPGFAPLPPGPVASRQ